MKRIYRSIGSITLGWLIGSCGGGGDSIVGPPPPTTATVTISSDTATLVPAATVQLSATAKAASGEQLQRTFVWTTSDPAKATVSTSGMVAGVAPGTATITATVDGKSGTSTVTVLEGGIISSTGGTLNVESGAVQIAVPPDALAASTSLSVAASSAFANDPRVVKGTPFEFGPTGTIFAKPVLLKIEYVPANLPAGTEESALQLYLHTNSGWEVVPGSTTDGTAKVVTGQVSHFSAYAILLPEPVAAIQISGPGIVNGATSLVVGGSEQLAATLTSSGGVVLSNRAVTWSSSDPTVASITSTGVVTAIKPGVATASASAGGKTSTIAITVSPVPVATVTVTPETVGLVLGVTPTKQLTVVTKDANGNVVTDRAVAWSSSNPAAATVDANGLVTAVSSGSTTITATSETKTGVSAITVTQAPVNAVTLSPGSATLVVGGTQQLTATLTDLNGIVLTGRTVTWASSNPATATVDSNGLVTGVAAGGPVTITATSETKTGTSAITVTAIPVSSVTLSAITTPMVVAGTQSLMAVTKDAANNTLTGRTVSWVSSNTAVLTVNSLYVGSPAGRAYKVSYNRPGDDAWNRG